MRINLSNTNKDVVVLSLKFDSGDNDEQTCF